MAERGVFVKDAAKLLKSVVSVSGVMEWARSCLKELFFFGVNFTDREELYSYRLDGRFGNVKLT